VLYDIFVELYNFDTPVVFLLSELSNLAFCSIILCILYYFRKLNFQEFVFWNLGFLSTIVFALTVIGPTLFPDNGGYLVCLRDLRDNLYFDDLVCQGSIESDSKLFNFLDFKRSLPAILFFLIPIPSIATSISLAFINKIYLLALYIFIRSKLSDDRTKFYLLVLMFLPTLLLYSSTGLRDILVMVVVATLFFTTIERKFVISTIFLLLLAAIKPQNAAVMMVLYAGIFLFRSHKSFLHLVIFLMSCLIIGVSFQVEILYVVNYFRMGFLNENGLLPLSGVVFEYQSFTALIIDSPLAFLKGIFSPGFGFSVLNIIFFPESIFLIILFIWGARYTGYFSESTNCLVFIVFYLGIVLNSIVVPNDATFLRYRFALVYFLLFHLLLMVDKKRMRIKNNDL
jgi:hypothetical protein